MPSKKKHKQKTQWKEKDKNPFLTKKKYSVKNLTRYQTEDL